MLVHGGFAEPMGSVDPRSRACVGFAQRAFLEGTGWSLVVPASPGSALPGGFFPPEL